MQPSSIYRQLQTPIPVEGWVIQSNVDGLLHYQLLGSPGPVNHRDFLPLDRRSPRVPGRNIVKTNLFPSLLLENPSFSHVIMCICALHVFGLYIGNKVLRTTMALPYVYICVSLLRIQYMCASVCLSVSVCVCVCVLCVCVVCACMCARTHVHCSAR